MTDAINTSNRFKTPLQSAENRVQKASEDKTSAKSGAAPASAVVELSSEQLLEQMKNIPEVNSNRVEQIKNAIASGEYTPNSEVIARKFAELENLLP